MTANILSHARTAQLNCLGSNTFHPLWVTGVPQCGHRKPHILIEKNQQTGMMKHKRLFSPNIGFFIIIYTACRNGESDGLEKKYESMLMRKIGESACSITYYSAKDDMLTLLLLVGWFNCKQEKAKNYFPPNLVEGWGQGLGRTHSNLL